MNTNADQVDQVEPDNGKAEAPIIAGEPIRLKLPRSFAIQHEIVAAGATNPVRAFAAALGVCWVGKGRPRVKYEACKYDPLAYGGAVIDELHGRGVAMSEISAAGGRAFTLLSKELITEKEVADRADFSGAEGPSTE